MMAMTTSSSISVKPPRRMMRIMANPRSQKSIIAEYFAAVACAESTPDRLADISRHTPHGAVHQQRVDQTGVVAPAGDDAVAGLRGARTLDLGQHIHIDDLCAVVEWDDRVWREDERDAAPGP